MKRVISFILIITLLTGTAYALTCEKATFPIFVNGEELYLENPPLAYDGKSYLPVKAIADAVNVKAEWKNDRVEISTLDIEALKDSCVMVRTGDVQGTYTKQASGVLIDYDEVLTVNHVTKGRSFYAIIYDDSLSFNPCSLADTSTSKDCSVLEPTAKNIKPVKIGDSDELQIGDKIYVISSPGGAKNTVTSGTVVGTGTTKTYGIFVFTTTAKVESGSSGGACFNSNGELIGMVISNSDENLSCIAPINDIRESLAS